jgi:3-oxoacyl-[acyl-carrier protein] reductase
LFDLTGKTAIVTGASGGIGGAIARALHSVGATIVVSGTKEEALSKLANELGERVFIKTCNLANSSDIEDLVEYSEKTLGKIDILVCNAGITKDNLAIRMKDEDFDEVINVNLKSSFILNRACIKKMMKAKYGRIINIASIVGVMGNPGQANYCASKAGLIGMSKALASEVAARGVTVNCVAPGFIETAMTDGLKDEHKQKLTALIPNGNMGKPEDVAYSVVFLASEQASYITGQTIHVNGGMLMV